MPTRSSSSVLRGVLLMHSWANLFMPAWLPLSFRELNLNLLDTKLRCILITGIHSKKDTHGDNSVHQTLQFLFILVFWQTKRSLIKLSVVYSTILQVHSCALYSFILLCTFHIHPSRLLYSSNTSWESEWHWISCLKLKIIMLYFLQQGYTLCIQCYLNSPIQGQEGTLTVEY